jgi:tetratricopeptide (TPR) repeat protein
MTCRLSVLPTCALLIAIAAAGACGVASAEPFVPADPDLVVETLRDRPLDRTDREFRQLRAALRGTPTVLPLALRVAQRAIEIARRDSDPRYLGYAQAALKPWHGTIATPASVRLFDAILLQSNHRFDEALSLLDQVLHENPDDAQAWLTRASILQVQARYAQAKASCTRLKPLGADVYAAACLAELESLSGNAQRALNEMNQLIDPVAATGAATPGWLAIIRAEMSERMGNLRQAELDYQTALRAGTDAYAKAAYADFLLDRGRAAEVITLLQSDQRADPLLLRLALAYQAANDPNAPSAVAALAARFAAARLRGDTVHLREETRFTLHLRHQPAEALRLAQQNWAVQKEPADARVLLEAARAAGDQDSLQSVRASLRESGLIDQRLARLLQ